MKTKKYKHAKTVGNETESIVECWYQEAGIPYKREDTMRNTRTRSKGSVDFESENMAVEVKKFTKLLTFKYKSEDHDISWSQIEYLSKQHNKGKVSGLLITEDNETFVFIRISNFLKWWIDVKRKSINIDIAKEIGYVVRNSEDLKRVLEV